MNNDPRGTPGEMRTVTGKLVNLNDFRPEHVDVTDIAWALSRILRYNGHIKLNYNVAMHSIIMSYAVPEDYAIEALFHDAGEAYTGDIIWPLKALFPELEEIENRITGKILGDLGDPAVYSHKPYEKSDVIAEWDLRMYKHECFILNRDGGVYDPDINAAWEKAGEELSEQFFGLDADYVAFLKRYYDLTPQEHEVPWERWANTNIYTKLFPEDYLSEEETLELMAEREEAIAEQARIDKEAGYESYAVMETAAKEMADEDFEETLVSIAAEENQ